jgi:hypothetical protein
MSPDEALEQQLKRYRQMTGEERVIVALRLHELSCELAREGIRRQHPAATPLEVERLLRERLALAVSSGGSREPSRGGTDPGESLTRPSRGDAAPQQASRESSGTRP